MAKPPTPIDQFCIARERPKPPGWEAQNLAQRLETAFGISLDRAMDYLQADPHRCDRNMLRAQVTLVDRLLAIGAKFGLEAERSRNREDALDRLSDMFKKREKSP